MTHYSNNYDLAHVESLMTNTRQTFKVNSCVTCLITVLVKEKEKERERKIT